MTKKDEKDSSNSDEEDPPDKKDHVSERTPSKDIPNEIEVNRKKEPKFREYVIHEINELGFVQEQDLIYSGAEKLGLSSVTTARYLKKMVSKVGLFQRQIRGGTYWIMYKDKIPS